MNRKYIAIGTSMIVVFVLMFVTLSQHKVTFDDKTAVVTVNDESASVSSLMTMVRYQQAVTGDYYDNMYAQYEAQGMQVNANERWDSEVEKSDEKDTDTSGMKVRTSGEQLVDNIATTLSSYLVICQQADAYGVSLTDDEKAQIDVVADNFIKNSDKNVLEADHITKDGVKAYLQWYTLYDKVYDTYVEQSDIEVTDDESKSMSVSYMVFSIDSKSDVYKTNALVKKQAQQILDTLSSKEDISELNFEDFSKEYSNSYASKDYIAYQEDLEAGNVLTKDDVTAIGKLKDGQMYDKLITDSNGNYYIFRLDSGDDKEAAAEYAKTLRQERIDEAFAKSLEGWKKDAKIKYNVDVLNQISVVDSVVYTGVQEESSEDDASVESEGVEIKSSEEDESSENSEVSE